MWQGKNMKIAISRNSSRSQTFNRVRATLASAIALTENGSRPMVMRMELNTAMMVYAYASTQRHTVHTIQSICILKSRHHFCHNCIIATNSLSVCYFYREYHMSIISGRRGSHECFFIAAVLSRSSVGRWTF